MSNRNRPGIMALSPEQLLEALSGGQDRAKQTPEERLKEAKQAFETLLDTIMTGCPDPGHKAVEDAALVMLKGMFKTDIVAEPVGDAVLKVLLHRALHNDDPGKGLGDLLGNDLRAVSDGLLIAGAVLRVAGQPDTAGIPNSTGVYL